MFISRLDAISKLAPESKHKKRFLEAVKPSTPLLLRSASRPLSLLERRELLSTPGLGNVTVKEILSFLDNLALEKESNGMA